MDNNTKSLFPEKNPFGVGDIVLIKNKWRAPHWKEGPLSGDYVEGIILYLHPTPYEDKHMKTDCMLIFSKEVYEIYGKDRAIFLIKYQDCKV